MISLQGSLMQQQTTMVIWLMTTAEWLESQNVIKQDVKYLHDLQVSSIYTSHKVRGRTHKLP